MVRYEGAALILAAFIIDMINCENNRERGRTLLYAGVAVLPLGIWMLGTMINWDSQASSHYLMTGVGVPNREKLYRFISGMFTIGSYELLTREFTSPAGVVKASKVLLFATFSFGLFYGLIKRQWNMLTLLIFLGCYMLIHAKYSRVLTRYYMPVQWIVLLISLYGLKSGWQLVHKGGKIGGAIIRVFQGILFIFARLFIAAENFGFRESTILYSLMAFLYMLLRMYTLPTL